MIDDLMIITSYYPPEIGAASNRIYHLSEGLKQNYNVTVVTQLPNYPTGKIFKDYKKKFLSKSHQDGIVVNRLWVYPSVSKNKIVRLFAMLSYSFSLIWFFIWHRIPNKVIIQSPPLLVSFTCLLFLRSKKRQLILNVSDLWPSAGLELGALKKGIGYTFLKKIERFNYKNANLIMGQSNEILAHIKQITTQPKLFLYRNYPDINIPKSQPQQIVKEKLTVVYAGLLGVAQGIYKLCNNLDYSHIEFHIYGSGAEEENIKDFIKKHHNLPLFFHGRLDRAELHQEIVKYDVTIIPLLNRIYGAVPSKIFEYAKLGLPMLYFGGGEAETLIDTYKLGWIAESGNYTNLNTVIATIDKSKINCNFREEIKQKALIHFDFNTQLTALKRVL